MLLSMSLIAKYLHKHHPEIHIEEDSQTIRGVRFFTDLPTDYSLEYVYLGKASGYFQAPRYVNALLLANGQNQILCYGAEYETLLNDVLSAFEYYAHFEQQLYTAAADHKPLQDMMNFIAKVIPFPLFIFDIEGNLLSKCHEEILEDPGDYFSGLKIHSMMGSRTISQIFVDKKGQISHDLAEYPQFLRTLAPEETGCVSMYLYQDGERVGYILLFVSESLDVAFGMCLEPILAKYCVNAAEFTSSSSSRKSNHSIMIQLLQDEDVAPAILRKLEKHLQFTSPGMLLVFRSLVIQNYTFRRMLCTELESSEIPCICCEYEDSVVILTEEAHLKHTLHFIQGRIPEQNTSLGISMPVQQFEHLHIAYQQCLFALGETPRAGIRCCRDLAMPYLLQNLRNTPMSTHLLHPAIGILKKYDEESETQLLETLRTFIRNSCRQSETAEQMHIHLNTLKYRLRRIIELTGIDFKNYDELLYVELSLAM